MSCLLSISEEEKTLWGSPARHLAIKCVIDGQVYESGAISSLSFDSASITGETFAIGSTYMNSIKMIFPSILESIEEGQEVEPHIGIDVGDGAFKFVPLGKFIIDKFDRDRNSIKTIIEANDQMILMGDIYESKLKYPAKIRDVALEIANLSGMEVDVANFSTLSSATIQKPIGYTYRQAIGLIAQFEAGFATFNRYGKLVVQRLRPTEYTIKPENYLLKGLTKNENTYRVGGINVRTGDEENEVLHIGSANGAQIELENKVMTRVLLQQIWDKVKTTSYFPFELKWQGNPALEAGDWIYVYDKEGNRYSVPNLAYSFDFNGGLSARSSANTTVTSEANYKYRGTLQQKIEYVESLLSSNGWNSNYYDNTEPKNPKEGDLWFKQNGKDMEIWIYQEIDSELQWVLEITTALNEELYQLIEDAKEAAEEAKKAGEDAEKAAEEAKQVGQEAKEAGEKAKEMVDEMADEVAKATNDANKAVAEANEALTQAGFATTAVQTAIQQSSTAVADAQEALKKANDLVSSVNEIEGSIIDIQGNLNTITGELQYKVDQIEFNTLEGKVNTNTINIQANSNAISLKADNSIVNVIDQTVQKNSAELSIQSGKISALVSTTDGHTTDIANLKVESGKLSSSMSTIENSLEYFDIPNILPNSKGDNLAGYRNWYATSQLFNDETILVQKGNSGTYGIRTNSFEVIAGETYSIMLDVGSWYSTTTLNYNYLMYLDESGNQKIGDISVDYQTTSLNTKFLTFKATKSGEVDILFGVNLANTPNSTGFRIRKIKVSKGDVKSDGWNPWYGDLTTVLQFSEFQQTVNGFQTTVNSQINNLQSQWTQMDGQITSVVKDLNNLNSGAGNLFVDSRGATNWSIATATGVTQTQYDEVESVCGKAKKVTMVSGSGGIHRSPIRKLTIGKTYSWSVYLKSNTTGNLSVGSEQGGTKMCALKNVWQKYTHTFVAKESSYYSFVFYRSTTSITELYIHSPVLVEGNIIPNWSDSISDLANQSQITQLVNNINLMVQKDDVINQINISTEGILISGKKVHITGQTTIDNAVIKAANIVDANITNAKIANLAVSEGKIANLSVTEGKIGNLAVSSAKIKDAAITTAKIGDAAITNAKIGNAAITNAKIQDATIASAKIASMDAGKIVTGTLDSTKVKVYGGNSSNFVQISSNQIEQYGTFSRTWQGKTTKHTTSMFLQNGYFRARNSSENRSLYFSDFGISTFADGDGSGKSSGTISFFDRQYSDMNGLTVTSNNGVVALQANGGSGRVWLESEAMLRLDSTQSGIALRPHLKSRTGNNTFYYTIAESSDASQTKGYIMYGSESGGYASGLRFSKASSDPRVQVVNTDYSTGGNTTIEAGVGEFNNVEARASNQYFKINDKDRSKMNLFVGKTADGVRRMGSDYLYSSSGSGKALHITSGGSIVAYSSSERFKTAIEQATDVNYHALLDLELKSWIYKSSFSLDEPIRRVYGLIAEDVERTGLTQYTEYNEFNEVEGYKPELWTLTIPILREHQAEIKALKINIEKLENQIKILQAS